MFALRKAVIGVLLMVAAFPFAANADFSGAYAPSHWTTTLTGPAGAPPGGGAPVDVDTTGAPSSITIIGGDSADPTTLCWDDNLAISRKGCSILYTTTAAGIGDVAFEWAYESFDNSGSAYYDIFGYFVEGLKTQLTDNFGRTVQSGSASFAVSAGQSFGFWLDCGDCYYYEAVATVRSFSAPIPEPGTAALLGLAIAGLGLWRRKQSPNSLHCKR